MVKRGPWQDGDRSAWRGRRRDGRNFLKAAEDTLTLTDPGQSGKPSMSNALLAVIAYGDALTIKFGGIKNAQDHRTLPRTWKQALGARADDQQMRRLSRLISQKNDIDYHHRALGVSEARDFLEQARRFVLWAEQQLQR